MTTKPRTTSLRNRFRAAKLAGTGAKLSATTDADDHRYRFRSNEQAADVAVKEVVAWLRAEAGQDGAHGSSPALASAAAYIEETL